jgi:phosphoglucomutase
MSGNAYSNYKKWLSSEAVSEEIKKELLAISGNDEEIALRFSAPLSFGTAGLRGIMAAGIGSMNVFTVSQATQGFADYIRQVGGDGVAIAYDTRLNSELYAHTAAEVMAGNGITCYVFDAPRPTPELSFALRNLNCVAGINITASHNPKEYNGYKAYWKDGAQIGPEQADAISEYIARCDIFSGAKKIPFDRGLKTGIIKMLGSDTDNAYTEKVLAERVNPNAIPSVPEMGVVFTPLHGAGRNSVPAVLKKAGVKKLFTVDEQMAQDGNFPTLKYPNPEYPEAFVLAEKLAEKQGCDLIIATDPDSDRMGMAVRSGEGYKILSGNQIGCLLLDYIISALRETGGFPQDAYAVKSIVTTELATEICIKNGVRMYDVLTGFKYIGEVIKKHELIGQGTFILGFEESYGYLKGTYARDKDAVVASLLAVEMAAYYRMRGLSVGEALEKLYEKYGFYRECVISKAYAGAGGRERMASVMNSLRLKHPVKICGQKVRSVRDYLSGEILNLKTGEKTGTGMPVSDVLYYRTRDAVIVVRPSGTEPKIKVYVMAKGKTGEEADNLLFKCRKFAEKIIK